IFGTHLRALTEEFDGPTLEIGYRNLVRQPAGTIVDPVPREGASPDHLGFRRAVGLDRERKRGPNEGWHDLDVWGTVELAGHRHRDASSSGLDEANGQLIGFPVGADVGHGNRGKEDLARSESKLGLTDPAPARVPVTNDQAVLD